MFLPSGSLRFTHQVKLSSSLVEHAFQEGVIG